MAALLDIDEAAKEASSLNLELPNSTDGKRFNTMNLNGFMYSTITENDQKFIDLASKPKMRVLEIGCAYGHVCLAALNLGATDFTAVDMEQDHLKILASLVKKQHPEMAKNVKLIVGTFPNPDLLDLLAGFGEKFDAILARNIFHFLHENQIQTAFDETYKLLKPGGKFFATILSPYAQNFKKDFRHAYDQQLKEFLAKVNNGEEGKLFYA